MLRSYTPADGLTLANASCGTISIFLCLAYIDDQKSAQLWAAFVLPLAALASGLLAEQLGLIAVIWIGTAGSFLAAAPVVFSPLLRMRTLPSQVEGS